MSVGILIVTHSSIGRALLDAVISVMEQCPLNAKLLPVSLDCDPDSLQHEAREMINKLDQGDGVLVITDMYGSTPSNIACRLSSETVKVVTGINLPMLVRIMNYPHLDLQQLVEKAVSAGREGVIHCKELKQ